MTEPKFDRRSLLETGAVLAVGATAPAALPAKALPARGALHAPPFAANAAWIGRDNPPRPATYPNQPPAPLLRRRFAVAGPVRSAVLRIAAFGYHVTEINGRAVSDAVLDPPPSQYEKTVFSRTIDVTGLVRTGDNVIGVTLGRAYASGVAGPEAPWVSEPRLLAQIDILLRDGARQQIVTDAAWKTADSATRDWLYFGEDHDARRELRGWSLPGFDDAGWSAARVQRPPTERVLPASAPPVRVVDTFPPARRTILPAGRAVYDFGKVTAGWARIRVKGPAGAKVSLAYSEHLQADGSVALSAAWGTTEPKMHVDSYTLRGGGEELWEPSFARHGFQFVQVEVSGGPLEAFALEAREARTPVEATGHFACSQPLLNRIHENQRRSLLLNHWGFPTDCTWRDRLGWTADTALYMDSGLLNFAGYAELYRDWLQTLRDTRLPDGSISIYTPDNRHFPLHNDPSWSGMIVLIPWTLYRRLGDAMVLQDSYNAMTGWLDLMHRKIAATGYLYTGDSAGDHSPPGSEAGGNLQLSPPEGTDITKNAHLFEEARTLARIARVLGRPADARRFGQLAARIRSAFNAAFLDRSANLYRTRTEAGYRQTSNLMPLAFGMVPAERRQAVFDNLVADVERRGRKLNTGALGTKLILPVLTEFGRPDLAYAIATQTEYPSWGYWVTQGATTSWETWRIEGPEQTKDHPFLGTVDDWFYEHLAGIQPAAPGYATVRIAPVFPQGLDRVEARVRTPRGDVACAWRREGGDIELDLALPRGAPAELVLPVRPGAVRTTAGAIDKGAVVAGRTVFRTSSARLSLAFPAL